MEVAKTLGIPRGSQSECVWGGEAMNEFLRIIRFVRSHATADAKRSLEEKTKVVLDKPLTVCLTPRKPLAPARKICVEPNTNVNILFEVSYPSDWLANPNDISVVTDRVLTTVEACAALVEALPEFMKLAESISGEMAKTTDKDVEYAKGVLDALEAL